MYRKFRDLVRSRVAPLVLVGVLGLLAVRTCESETASVTVRYDLGEQAAAVSLLRADYFQSGEPIDVYFEHRFTAPSAAPLEHSMTVPAGVYEARIRLQLPTGTRALTRRFEAGHGNVAVIDLRDELP